LIAADLRQLLASDSPSIVADSPPPTPLPATIPIATEAPSIDDQDDPTEFEAPYDDYTVTQGPHGGWYGHMAIDITAGKDTPIKSPISGIVTDLFVDQWGNPNLVNENEVYLVSLLHCNNSVAENNHKEIGQIVGMKATRLYY
jgi:murein DD-endopeptidase MepM/ murein hydrolase activator NlpD